MDPLALSGAFATVVGLLANFKAERSGADLNEFMSWLREQHQEQLAQAIAQNKALSFELSSLLATNHEELVERLASLNQKMARIASEIEGFSGIAKLLGQAPKLSQQARSVLEQIVVSGANFVMEHKLSTGEPTELIFVGGAVGQVKYEEQQHINEDLEALVAVGLLRLEFASKGSRKFSPTRAGVDWVRNCG